MDLLLLLRVPRPGRADHHGGGPRAQETCLIVVISVIFIQFLQINVRKNVLTILFKMSIILCPKIWNETNFYSLRWFMNKNELLLLTR